MGSPVDGEVFPDDAAGMDASGEDPAWYQDVPDFDARAMAAATAAYQADVAAKNCEILAQWVLYLREQVNHLQGKVTDLEDWKRKALDDVRRLRDEQKVLKQRVSGGPEAVEESALPPKATTLPALVREGPPPGLGDPPGLRRAPQDTADGTDGDAVTRRDTDLSSSGTLVGNTSGSLATEGDSPPEGIQVTHGEVEGRPCETAEWRISHLSTKLKGCMGKALVSPSFTIVGAEDVRLMVFAEGKDAAKGPRSKRQKELYAKKIVEGPLDACLKVKIPDFPHGGALEYYLNVGGARCGPFKHDFKESSVNGCDDFGVDWLQQLDQDHSLTLRVEVLKEPAAA